MKMIKIKSMTISFQESAEIQTFCQKWINQQVNEYFGNDNSGNRAYVKGLLTHKATDNFELTIARLLLKNELVNGLDEMIFGEPISSYFARKNFNPTITLKFLEINKPKDRTWYQQCRIAYQISNTILKNGITPNELKLIAQKIHQQFKNYTFKTGFSKVNYEDTKEDIKILLFPDNKLKGQEIVSKILITLGMKIDETQLSFGEYKQRPKQGIRSISATVKFNRAEYVGPDKQPKVIATNLGYLK